MFACVRNLTCNVIATTKTNSLRLLAAYHKSCKSTACSLQYLFSTQRHVCVFSVLGLLAAAQRLPHKRCHMLNGYTGQQHCCRSPALPHHRCAIQQEQPFATSFCFAMLALLQLLMLIVLLLSSPNSALDEQRSHWTSPNKHEIPNARRVAVRGGSQHNHARTDAKHQSLHFRTVAKARLSRLLHAKREFRAAFSSSLEKCLLRATRPDALPVPETQLQKLLLATKKLETVSDLHDAVSLQALNVTCCFYSVFSTEKAVLIRCSFLTVTRCTGSICCYLLEAVEEAWRA
jgi:hypothetical protein